jgi:predicted MFS family arabinose efflux permease
MTEQAISASPAYSPRYKTYLLLLLALILAFNYVDRLALGIVLENIKADLELTDTQLGFLSGIAFALFYSVMGIPIARWADRGDRVLIISSTAALWSVAVAACASAMNFTHLLLIRVAVAIGEAGCTPPALSLIADHFARKERARATAIYGLGGPLSGLFGFFLAGWLNEAVGWRMTFVILGLPGLALAALAWFTLREPRRDSPRTATSEAPRLSEVFSHLRRTRSFVTLLAAISVLFFFFYGILQWQPAFFMRSHGLSSSEVGLWFALMFGGGGLAGLYLGGELSTRFAANNEALQLKLTGVAIVIAGVASLGIYLASDHHVAFLLLGLHVLALNMMNGPIFGTLQTLVPERMRAMAFALIYLFANLIGLGLGPLAAGAFSDALRPQFGDESLRSALLLLTPGYLVAAWLSWRASSTIASDIALTAPTQP